MPSFLVSFHPYSKLGLPFPSCGKHFPEPFVFNRGPSDQSINELLRIIGNYAKPPYLIFVISFTLAGFFKTKFYTQKND